MSETLAALDVTGRPVSLRDVDLGSFFTPRTVAVIGASDTAGRPTTAMYEKIRSWARGTGATVFPVNPNRDSLGGVACHRSVLDVPADVDLAVILLGNPVPALQEAIEKKARFAVVFAAGFAEVGRKGQRLQERIEQMVEGSDLHLLGPNTNLNAFEQFRQDLLGPAIALITQSGHQGRPVFQGQDLGIRLSHWAPTGNEADLEFADFAAWFSRQPEVGAVAAYIEGFKDGRTLLLAADEAAVHGVPIVCVKVGRTEQGRSMALAHTGHLTGSDAVTSAAFRQFGITRVDGLDELLDTSATLARCRPPAAGLRRGAGVCVYSISGGTGAHMADMVSAAGLPMPPLSAPTQRQLHDWIPSYLRVSNPVDNGGAPAGDWRGRKILDAMVADPNVAVLLCPITGAVPSIGDRLAADLVAVAATTDKPVLVVWGSPVGDEHAYREVLLKADVPVFRTFANAVGAAKAWFDYHDFRSRHRSPFARPLRKPLASASAGRALLQARRPLSEHESKQLLAAYGIPVTPDVLCTSASEAARAAQHLGLPVVLKACGPDLLHKSDGGLVEVGLLSAAAVRDTFHRLRERAPGADGILVCPMVSDGVETVVGVSRDGLFGPVVMFGSGGVLLEVMGDVTFRVPPFNAAEARRMVSETRGSPVLRGARGRPPADLGALVDVIMKVQRLAVDCHAELAELDVNPLTVLPQGAVALDALAVPG